MSPSADFIAESFKPSSSHAMLALLQLNFEFRNKTAQSGGTSTITLDADANARDDFYTGKTITILSGTGSGQTKTITDYVGSTKVATVSSAWSVQPDNTSVFKITEALYYVANNEAITSNGQTYQPLWFDFEFPDSTEERLPDVRILIDNTNLTIAQRLREHEGDQPTAIISAITTLDLDYTELGPYTLTIKSAGNRNPETLEINTGVEDLLNRSLLPVRYSPKVTPGVLFVA